MELGSRIREDTCHGRQAERVTRWDLAPDEPMIIKERTHDARAIGMDGRQKYSMEQTFKVVQTIPFIYKIKYFSGYQTF